MASAIKVGQAYQTSVSGVNGIVAAITKNNGRKVVELVTLEGTRFSTLPRGIRARVSA